MSYNRMSRFYDILAGTSEKKLIRKGVEKLEIQSGEKVLDIGCGTGTALM
ncbi:2-heptaprenyl-1,4-naphthoquinone methyltransferase, partial [candidate division WOR-3 bacterium]|nr:2-heptaprenyl-1,4-naphthoquinone methyltransferase [candidate division WOR-3 bacterium]